MVKTSVLVNLKTCPEPVEGFMDGLFQIGSEDAGYEKTWSDHRICLFGGMFNCGVGTPVSTAEVAPVSTPISTQTSLPSTDTPVPAPLIIPPTAVPTAIGGGGNIAFSSEQNGSSEIYVVNPDGSGLSPLANEITPKFPAWLPDGSKIAFWNK